MNFKERGSEGTDWIELEETYILQQALGTVVVDLGSISAAKTCNQLSDLWFLPLIIWLF